MLRLVLSDQLPPHLRDLQKRMGLGRYYMEYDGPLPENFSELGLLREVCDLVDHMQLIVPSQVPQGMQGCRTSPASGVECTATLLQLAFSVRVRSTRKDPVDDAQDAYGALLHAWQRELDAVRDYNQRLVSGQFSSLTP